MSPGITSNLPGTLIEDVTSTDVAATVLCDSALVELVNSVTPYGANAFILLQLGQNVYGVQQQTATNTTVQVVFVNAPGFVIPVGFQVSDGVYAYRVRDGGVVMAGGQSAPLYCVANTPGSWAVPSNTVTQISSSYSSATGVLTCFNPYPGNPGQSAETEESYRGRVLRAGRAAGQGMPSYVKTLLANVPGVQQRLVAMRQVATNGVFAGGYELIVGGGDPYAVAFAAYQGLSDVSVLVGSSMVVVGITNAANGVVSTALNHGYVTGETVQVQGVVGMYGINAVPLMVTVIDEKTFSTGVNTTLLGYYQSGGVLTPNPRNQAVTLRDYPDTYVVNFVVPPQQLVTMTALWNTSITGYVNVAAVAQLAAPALAAVVNAVPVGQPLLVYDLEDAFRTAVASVLPSSQLTRMVFEVSINGVGVAAIAGTGVIAGDFESYMFADPQGLGVNVVQG